MANTPSSSSKDILDEMTAMVQNGFTTLAMGLGSKLGLFQRLVDAEGPVTSQQLADNAGFKERYVREWLAAMVTARMVTTDDSSATYWMSDAHKVALRSGGDQLLVMSEGLPLLAAQMERLGDCFSQEGPAGIGHEHYTDFHPWRRKIALSSDPTKIIQSILDLSNQLKQSLDRGANVIDIGCGMGQQVIAFANLFPNSTFLGVDLSEESVQEAGREAESLGITNVSFEFRNVCDLPREWSNTFDLATSFDVIHDLAKPGEALKAIWRILKKGRVFANVDGPGHSKPADNLSNPWASAWYSFSLFSCMTRALSEEGGEGPGAMWGIEDESQALRDAGFTVANVKEGQTNNIYLCQKPE